jgi:hypothetical protein
MSLRARAAARTIALTAVKFTNEPTSTSRADCTAMSATVPFVVVKRIVFPSIASRVYSRGEFPRSKPGMMRFLRSPAASFAVSNDGAWLSALPKG